MLGVEAGQRSVSSYAFGTKCMSQLNRGDMIGQIHDAVYTLSQVLFHAETALERLELQKHLQHAEYVLLSPR